MEIIDIIDTLFTGVWDLFQIEYPGLGITIAGISIGSLCVVLSFRILSTIFGMSFSPASILGRDRKAGNNRRIKISKERKGDKL